MDEEGFLFLTDRSVDLIISGGVNVYPTEIDTVAPAHPKVADSATIGVPNDEWGEEVKSVVELAAGVEPNRDLEAELIEFARERLAHFKCPKTIDFVDSLPARTTGRSTAGCFGTSTGRPATLADWTALTGPHHLRLTGSD